MAEVNRTDVHGGTVASTEVHDFGQRPSGITFPVVVYCDVCGTRRNAAMTFEDRAAHYVCDVCHSEWTA